MNKMNILGYKGATLFLKELEKKRKDSKVLIPILERYELITIMKVFIESLDTQIENTVGPKPWTPEEIKVLTKNYKSKEGFEKIEGLLDRSERSIKRKLARMNLV